MHRFPSQGRNEASVSALAILALGGRWQALMPAGYGHIVERA